MPRNLLSVTGQFSRRRLATLLAVVALCFTSSGMARADQAKLSIANASFEDPVLGDSDQASGIVDWTASPSDSTTLNPTTGQFPGEAPDGANVIVLGGVTASQVLTASLEPNTEYVLRVEVGRAIGYALGGHSVQLVAAGTVLAEESAVAPAQGTFESSVVRYVSTSSDATLGQPLEIRLAATSATFVFFDDVRLSAIRPPSLSILNASFEDPVLSDSDQVPGIVGWTASASNSTTVNPTTGLFPGEAPDGANVVVLGADTATQELAASLAPDIEYVLMVEVGRALGYASGSYSVQLVANGTVLGEESSLAPAEGSFETSVVRYASSSSDPELGQPLEVRISATSASFVFFDHVRLSATPLLGILNSSFEDPVLGDSEAVSGIAGWTIGSVIFNSTTLNPSTGLFPGEAPEGANVVLLSGETATQALATSLESNTEYVLVAEVGRALGYALGSYAVQLVVGGTVLAAESSLAPAQGSFETSVVRYVSSSSESELGKPLEVRIAATSPTFVFFDYVRLFTPVQPIFDDSFESGGTGAWSGVVP